MIKNELATNRYARHPTMSIEILNEILSKVNKIICLKTLTQLTLMLSDRGDRDKRDTHIQIQK